MKREYKSYNDTTGEYIETQFEHLNLPDDLTKPVINGVERTLNLGIVRAPGWHYTEDGMIFIPAFKKVKGQSINFGIGINSKEGIVFEFKRSKLFASRISISDIFTICFNVGDADQIKSLVGVDSPYLTSKFIKQRSFADLQLRIKNKKIKDYPDLINRLRTLLTKQTIFTSPNRLYELLSLDQFKGMQLGESVEVNGIFYPMFTTLGDEEIFNLEHGELQSVTLITDDSTRLKISIPNELYALASYKDLDGREADFRDLEIKSERFSFLGKDYKKDEPPINNNLSIYCHIVNRLLNFREAGISISMQDYGNQAIQSFSDVVDDFIRSDIEEVESKIANCDTMLEGVNGHMFSLNRAEKLIRNADSAMAVLTNSENPLAELSQGNVLVRDVKFLPKEAVSVAAQDLGVIDPVDSSESKSIGKTTPLTVTTKRIGNELYMPLFKVKDGVNTNEVENVPVGALDKLFIGEAGCSLTGNVLARHHGEVKLFPASVITHIRVSPFSTTSICRGTAVFMENTDQKRTQMAANTQKQARTILRPSRARMETGIESIVANGLEGPRFKSTVREIFKDYAINGSDVDGYKFKLTEYSSEGMGKAYRLTAVGQPEFFAHFTVSTVKTPSGSSSFYELYPPQNGTDLYLPDEVVYKHHNVHFETSVDPTDKLDYHTNGDPNFFNVGIGNGQDLLVMYGVYGSYTNDDASLFSDRVVRDMSQATPVIVTKKFEFNKTFDKDIEEHTGVYLGKTPEGFSSAGVPIVGTYLRPGSIWLYRYESNIKTGTITAKNSQLSDNEQGEVIAVTVDRRYISVTLSRWIDVQVGDKFSGREGNKTIISKVMRAELMPFHPETGRSVDVVLNPHGLPSRNNVSQLGEVQLTANQYAKNNAVKITPPFSGELFEMVKNFETEGKKNSMLRLIDPNTGQFLPNEVFCGYMYFLRSVHIAHNKIHGIGDSTEIDAAFKQPVGGSELHQKGQSISAMEKDCLISYGASGILEEIHSVLSADRAGYHSISEEFINNPYADSVDFKGLNFHKEHMNHVLLAFHCSLQQTENGLQANYMSDKDMDEYIELNLNDIRDELTRPDYSDVLTCIPFAGEMITPVAVRKFEFTSIIRISKIDLAGDATGGYMSSSVVEDIISGRSFFTYIESGDASYPLVRVFPYNLSEEVKTKRLLNNVQNCTGMKDLISFLKQYPSNIWLNQIKEELKDASEESGVFNKDLNRKLKKAKAITRNGGFGRFITTKFPVLPNMYRQAKGEVDNSDSITAGYKDIAALCQSYAFSSDEGANRLYQRMSEMMLPSDSNTQRLSLFEFMAKKETGGRIRGKILKTRVMNSLRSTVVSMHGGHPDTIGLPIEGAVRVGQPIVVAMLKSDYPELVDPNKNDIDLVSYILEIITLPADRVAKISPWKTDTHAKIQGLRRDIKKIIDGRYVFYGRAPSLHETSQRGAKCFVHDEKVLYVHSLTYEDFNADNDGDQMYVVMPMTTKAIEDIRTKMLPSVNTLRYNDGNPSLSITQDSLLGLFFATRQANDKAPRPISNLKQLENLVNLRHVGYRDTVIININNKLVKTTAGRFMVNEIIDNFETLHLHEDGFYRPNVDLTISSSGKAENGVSIRTLQKTIAETYDGQRTTSVYARLQYLGYTVATKEGHTIGIGDLTPILEVPKRNEEIKKYVETARTLEELGMLPEDAIFSMDTKVRSMVREVGIMDLLPESNAYWKMITSGSKGKEAQAATLFGVVGFVGGGNGKPLSTPILSNLIMGLSQFQVEDLSYTQRENAISTVFETSKPGESMRSGSLELAGLIIEPTVTNALKERQLNFFIKKSQDVFVGTTRADAVKIERDLDLHYNGVPLTMDVVRQLMGYTGSQLELDEGKFLFFDVAVHPLAEKYFERKMRLDGTPVTRSEFVELISSLKERLDLATHINEFDLEYGIQQSHAGFRAGAKKPFALGETIGIKASTATSQQANQMTISKRHGVASEGLASGIDMFKDAIQNGKFFGGVDGSYEILAPEDGTIQISVNDQGTFFVLYGVSGINYFYFVSAKDEHLRTFSVVDEDLVFKGQSIIQPKSMPAGERMVSPLNSFVWNSVEVNGLRYPGILPNPDQDLVQMIRFHYMVYLESLYAVNGIELDVSHYTCFALQATRHVEIVHDPTEKRDEGYFNLVTYLKEVKDKEPEVVTSMLLTNSSKTIMLTAGPVAAICYRDGITVASESSISGPLREYGATSKVIFGEPLDKDLNTVDVAKVNVGMRKPKTIIAEEYTAPVVYDLTEEDSNIFDSILGEDGDDLFAGMEDESDDLFGGMDIDDLDTEQAKEIQSIAEAEREVEETTEKSSDFLSVDKSSLFSKE